MKIYIFHIKLRKSKKIKISYINETQLETIKSTRIPIEILFYNVKKGNITLKDNNLHRIIKGVALNNKKTNRAPNIKLYTSLEFSEKFKTLIK